MANAGYTFLPWLRLGMAAGITRPDGTMTGAPRASVPVTLAINAGGAARSLSTALALYGPGEVAGIQPKQVIRQWPPPGVADAGFDDLAMVELSQPDLPWRYTPATANAQSRVRPWLVLAVLRDDEIVSETPGGDGRLPSITVAGSALPRLDQSWAWSHVQVDGFDPAKETFTDVLRQQPWRVRSRLLGPRRLHPRTRYTAVVVPAFERGRRAGLREPLPEDLDGLAPAWTGTSAPVALPVYVRWSFHTGAETVDFEVLARRLTARQVGNDVGRRDLDASTPDPALPPASPQPLPMSGPLTSPAAGPDPWPPAERTQFVAALTGMLNAPANLLDGIVAAPLPGGGDGPPPPPPDSALPSGLGRFVAPPLWGQWHAATDRLDPEAGASWFHELNADPRLRATAGLGAEVVRRAQEPLMAAAWDQLDGILAANEVLRRAQLAREAAVTVRDKHLARLDTETLVSVSAPLLARFTAGGGGGTIGARTFHSLVDASPIPDGALDGQLRRVTRPAGPVARRAARGAGAASAVGGGSGTGLLARLNQGGLRPRLLAPPLEGPNVKVSLIPEALLDPDNRVPPPGWQPTVAGASLAGDRAAGNDAVQRFLVALDDLVKDVATPAAAGPVLVPVNLAALGANLLSKMDPRVTVADGIRSRLRFADWVAWEAEDPLEPVMAAPEFDRPMYESLRELSQDWLLPGAGTIPPDTVTLVVSNQRFIESYLAGLNHEMARELLYREFPTDQRGTYFAQFWDSRAALTPSGGDITPMHTWHRDRALGKNSGRDPAPTEDHIVLLVKGEILRRFPTATVSAVRAALDQTGQRTLGNETRYPIFQAHLEPDVTLFGFDLVPSQVRGTETGDQGWFFVLTEHSSEPRFGLDADNGEYAGRPAAWRDLNWAHLAADQAALGDLDYLDLDGALPDTGGIVPRGEPPLAWHGLDANGSDLAWITLQPPFRVAIHGSDMLPEDPRQ